MMTPDSLFFLSISASLLFFLIYLGGNIIWAITSFAFRQDAPEAFPRFFLKLAFGFLATVVFTALFYTKGKTVNAIFLPFFLYIIIKRFQISGMSVFSGFTLKGEGFPVLVSLFVLNGFVLLMGIKTGFFFSGEISPRFLEDDYFYLAIAKFMGLLSLENTTPWYSLFAETPKYVRNPEVYHYGDLWTIAFALKTTLCSPIYTLRICLQAIGMTLGWVGFVALFRRYSKVEIPFWLVGMLSFVLITQWGYIPKYSGGTGSGFTVILAWKGITGLLMLQWAAVLYSFERFRNNAVFFLPIAALPILNILFLPSVLGAMSLWGIIRWIKVKSFKEGIPIMVSTVVFLWILFFYGFMSGFPDLSEGGENTSLLSFGFILDGLWVFARAIGEYLIHFFPVLAGFAIIHYNRSDFKNRIAPFLILLMLIMGVSALFQALIHHHKESFQLSYITFWACNSFFYFAVFQIVSESYWTKGLGQLSVVGKIFIVLFFIQYIPGQYSEYRAKPMQEKDISSGTSPEFIEKVSEILKDTQLIAYWNQREPEKGHMCNDCHFTGFMNKPIWAITINTPEFISPESDYAVRVTQSPFYAYLLSLKKQNLYTSYEAAQISFIQKYSLRFLLSPMNARFPEAISSRIKDSITDKGSATRLYILDL